LKALCWELCALAVLGPCLGCAAKIAPETVHERAPAPRQESEGNERSCPRVERARRMWSGFLVDVPNEVIGRALDVVVPIQAALGQTFCAPLLRDCRPATLLSVELTDARANEALLRVELESALGMRELPLKMSVDAHDSAREQNSYGAESWRAEPASLAEYLAACRK
jgi:hypothetical protein